MCKRLRFVSVFRVCCSSSKIISFSTAYFFPVPSIKHLCYCPHYPEQWQKTAMWAAAQHLLLEESVINILIHGTLVIHSGIIIETQTLLLTYCWKVDRLNTGKETCEVRLTRFSRALVLLQTALKHWKLTSTVASDLPDHRTALRWKENIM